MIVVTTTKSASSGPVLTKNMALSKNVVNKEVIRVSLYYSFIIGNGKFLPSGQAAFAVNNAILYSESPARLDINQ